MTINYRTVDSDGRPPVDGEPNIIERYSKKVLVWQWCDGRYIGPYTCYYKSSQDAWTDYTWKVAKPVYPQDKWVWVEELEPGVRTMSRHLPSEKPKADQVVLIQVLEYTTKRPAVILQAVYHEETNDYYVPAVSKTFCNYPPEQIECWWCMPTAEQLDNLEPGYAP